MNNFAIIFNGCNAATLVASLFILDVCGTLCYASGTPLHGCAFKVNICDQDFRELTILKTRNSLKKVIFEPLMDFKQSHYGRQTLTDKFCRLHKNMNCVFLLKTFCVETEENICDEAFF